MSRTSCAVRRSLILSLVVVLMMAPALVERMQAQDTASAKPVAGVAAARAGGVAHTLGGEDRAVRAFDAAKADKANALALEAFLEKMPKGGDLHMHLSGAIYAETFLKDAAADGLCVNAATLSFVKSAGKTSDDAA